MEAPVSLEVPSAAPVLGYAIQQRRWEKGVQWLAGVVCLTQALLLPAGACDWIDAARLGLPAWYFGTKWLAILSLILTLGSFATFICSLLLLCRVRQARGAFIVCAVITIFLWSAQKVLLISHLFPGSVWFHARFFSDRLGEMVVWCYPPVLLSMALLRRSWRASGIWWITAGAAMLVAMPMVFTWVLDFHGSWISSALSVFSGIINGQWWDTVAGVGQIAGDMACFSVFAAVAWTVYRGASGRWALMICAALWAVFAAGRFGAELAGEIQQKLLNPRLPIGSYDLTYVIRPIALALGNCAVYLAFPLAIRAALTFSDVRAKLEGNKVEGGSEQ